MSSIAFISRKITNPVPSGTDTLCELSLGVGISRLETGSASRSVPVGNQMSALNHSSICATCSRG